MNPVQASTYFQRYDKTLNQWKEDNKFKCTIYYLTITGLKTISMRLVHLLIQAEIPMKLILAYNYPLDNPEDNDTAVLFFSNCYHKHFIKNRLRDFIEQHYPASRITFN